MLLQVDQLFENADWRGLAAMELKGREVADAIRPWIPGNARFVYCRLGLAFDALGDFVKAIEYHKQCLGISKEVGNRMMEGAACGNLGNAYSSLGDLSQAIELHTQCLAIAQELGDRAGEGNAGYSLGNALKQKGNLPAAARALVQGLAAFQRVERDIGAHDNCRVFLFEQQQATYRVLQGVLLGLEKPGWALGVSTQAKGRALLYHLTAGSLVHSNEEDSSMLATDVSYEDVCEAWWREVQQDARAEGHAGAERIVEYSFLSDRNEYSAARRKSRESPKALAIWVLTGMGELLGSTTVSTRVDIAEALKIMGVRGRDDMMRQSQRQSAEDAVQEDASLMRGKVVEAAKRDQKVLGTFYQHLLAPVEAHIEGATEVLIIPHKELFDVPWAALFDCKTGQYLIERYVLRVAPSLRVARTAADQLRGIKGPEEQGHALVVGNPLLTRTRGLPLCEAEAEAEFVSSLLTSVGFEVRALMRQEAVKEAVLSKIEDATWGHFACHCSFDTKALMLSESPAGAILGSAAARSLAVTVPLLLQGLLTGDSEVHENVRCHGCELSPIRGARWKCSDCCEDYDLCNVCHSQFHATGQYHIHGHEFNRRVQTSRGLGFSADLTMEEVQVSVRMGVGSTVVLSACNSGRGKILGEGVVGLSRGFLFAGAAATVVSLWSVDDASTSALMKQMYKHLKFGRTTAQALRLAMLHLLHGHKKSSRSSKWRLPLYWAAFLVVGANTRLPGVSVRVPTAKKQSRTENKQTSVVSSGTKLTHKKNVKLKIAGAGAGGKRGVGDEEEAADAQEEEQEQEDGLISEGEASDSDVESLYEVGIVDRH